MRRTAALFLTLALPLCLALALIVLLPRGTTGAPPPPRADVHPQVWREIREQGETTFIVYLRQQPQWSDIRARAASLNRVERRRAVVDALRGLADRTQPQLLSLLAQPGLRQHVRSVQRLWIVNALVVRGDEKALILLAQHPAVARILPNRVHRLPDNLARPPLSPQAWHLVQIAADRVHRELGITGRGVVVANMDTGVDWTHPALRETYRGKAGDHNYNWFDVTGTYPREPGDGHGHGTFTMGLLVGRGDEFVQVGVAPGATWIAVKVFDDEGKTTDAQIHQAFQWILAPTDLNGQNPDPSRAPDIVSNSWGSDNGGDETFLTDVMAWRAAGIIPVFAAGNNGEVGPGSVGTPGAFAQVIAAGAVDANGLVAEFSSRGPAPTGILKPDVTAPGVNIFSTIPGGHDYGSGTSFSTPIVAGVLALMREANPNLGFDALYQLLTRTSDDFGPPGPDNDYGWGRVNAYAAVRAALDAGALSGRVTSGDGTPIPGATVAGTSLADPDLTFVDVTDENGVYRVTVPAGTYTLTVRGFGHAPATVSGARVMAGLSTIWDVRLTPLPRFPLTVVVTATGRVITHALVSLAGTPISATVPSDPERGMYTLRAPAGTYTLTVQADGFRTARRAVRLPAESPVVVSLRQAPRVLLVNGDGWAGDNVLFFYRRLLDRAGYPFDEWNVQDEATIPDLADLQPYDVVILAHPLGSPGWYEYRFDVDFWQTLQKYVTLGGRVVLTGPDIGFWESGMDISTRGEAALRDLFGVAYVEDKSNAQHVVGLQGDISEGITLTLNALLAYKNQFETDVITPTAGGILFQVYDVSPPNGAGVRHATETIRTVYLAYGLEGVNPDAGAALVDRVLTWLTSPALGLAPFPAAITLGQSLPVTLTLHNPTSVPWPRVPISLVASPALVAEGPTQWVVDIPAHSVYTLTTRYRMARPLPDGTPLRVTARAAVLGSVMTASRTTTVVGPNLDTSTVQAPAAIEPRTIFNAAYVVANTGSLTATVTMSAPLPPGIRALPLTTTLTLTAGGRYLVWTGDLGPAVRGRDTYTYTTSDMPGGPSFSWLSPPDAEELPMGDDRVVGPLPLPFSFPFFGREYTEMWVSSNGWLAFVEPSSAYPINRDLPTSNGPAALVAPFWDDLNPSQGGRITWYADGEKVLITWEEVPHYYAEGAYTFQVILYPDGRIRFQYLTLQGDVESATVGIQNEDQDQALRIVYNAPFLNDGLAIEILPPQPERPSLARLPVALAQTDAFTDNTPVPLTAVFRDVSGLTVTRTVTPVVRPADFSASRLVVPPALPIGNQATLTLRLENQGVGRGRVFATVALPSGVTLVSGNLHHEVALAPGEFITLPMSVAVSPHLTPSLPLTFTLVLTDAAHPAVKRVYVGEAARSDVRADWTVSPALARQGQRITSTLRLANLGNLSATVALTHTLPPGLEPITEALPADVAYDESARRMTWAETLPRTREDYIWEDNHTGRVPFAWFAPPGMVTIIDEGDDVTVGPIALGFSFPFYEQQFEHIFVNSNGWLSFTARDRRDFINRRLPSPYAPPNLLAPWWDDLYVPVTGTVRFWTDERGLAVITWDGVTRLGSGQPYTFQVMLDASGIITYQYRSMQGQLNSATIGLQDATGQRGVTVAHDDPAYMEDGRAIRFLPPVFRAERQFPLRVTAAPDVRGPLTLTLTLAEPYTRPRVLQQTVHVNLADFNASSVALSKDTIALHERVTVTLRLRNTGVYTGTADVTMTVPAGLQVVASDGQVVDGAVRWTRDVGPGAESEAHAVVELVEDRADGEALLLQVAERGGWRATVLLTVLAPDLSRSVLDARPTLVLPGEPVTVVASLINVGHLAAPVHWSLSLPPGARVKDVGAKTGAPPTRVGDAVVWQGNVPPRSAVDVWVVLSADGNVRWVPEATMTLPNREYRLRGPRVWWGWRGWLPALMR